MRSSPQAPRPAPPFRHTAACPVACPVGTSRLLCRSGRWLLLNEATQRLPKLSSLGVSSCGEEHTSCPKDECSASRTKTPGRIKKANQQPREEATKRPRSLKSIIHPLPSTSEILIQTPSASGEDMDSGLAGKGWKRSLHFAKCSNSMAKQAPIPYVSSLLIWWYEEGHHQTKKNTTSAGHEC